MQLTTIVSLIFLSLLSCSILSAAASSADSTSAISVVGTKHSHNGRMHSHILPASGIKHFHRHSHNGRSHIHPFSADIGFKHTHSSPQKKLATNSVKHQHGDRWHSHLLPRSGLKHPHRHKHGGRTHTHPLPANGVNHYHRVNPKQNIAKNKTSVSNDTKLDSQIVLAMQSPKLTPTLETTPFNQSENEYSSTSVQKHTNKKTANINEIISQLSLTNKITRVKIKPAIKQSKKRKVRSDKSLTRKKPKLKRKELSLPKPEAKKDIVKNPTKEQQLSSSRQFEIGLRYEHGTGVEKNLEQAAKWYRRAAEQGHTKAQFNLASLYEHGKGVEKNPGLAIKWYKAAAMKGEVETQ